MFFEQKGTVTITYFQRYDLVILHDRNYLMETSLSHFMTL